jgi:hypothetical protein
MALYGQALIIYMCSRPYRAIELVAVGNPISWGPAEGVGVTPRKHSVSDQ